MLLFSEDADSKQGDFLQENERKYTEEKVMNTEIKEEDTNDEEIMEIGKTHYVNNG